MSRPALELRELGIQVGDWRLVLDAPVTLEGGRVYLVRGASGTGKSTVARVLLGLGDTVAPRLRAAGDVVVNAPNGAGTDRRYEVLGPGGYRDEAREHFAFMPQAGSLGFVDELGVEANATLFSALPRRELRPHVERLAERFGILPLPEPLAHASGGQKMRLSAVRALVPRDRSGRRPAVLVADEPTTGLDPAAAREVAESIVRVAREESAVVLVVTHEPGYFVDPAELGAPRDDDDISVVACTPRAAAPGERPLEAPAEVARFRREAPPAEAPPARRWWATPLEWAEGLGAALLAPLALVVGLLGLRARTLRPVLRDAVRPLLSVGTWLFVGVTALFVAVTIGYFIFFLTPSPELTRPIIMPDILAGYGVALVCVIVPMFAAVFATAKNGAAGAARLSASVRAGLLDSLALARLRPETYALVPAVVGQILSLAATTALACALGVVAGALTFRLSGSPLGFAQTVQLMYSGVEAQAGWLGWLVAKTVASGAVGGMLAALFGLRPTQSEQDVANAVHRTLVWSGVCVLAVQCLFVVAQLG